MALITCSECKAQVSSSAAACPRCGAPVGSSGIHTPLSTIQQTSKQLKTQILFSALLFWVGVIWFIAATNNQANTSSGFAMFSIIAGFVLYIVTRLRIWWHHK